MLNHQVVFIVFLKRVRHTLICGSFGYFIWVFCFDNTLLIRKMQSQKQLNIHYLTNMKSNILLYPDLNGIYYITVPWRRQTEMLEVSDDRNLEEGGVNESLLLALTCQMCDIM